MIGIRIAGSLLAVATLTAVTACSTPNQPAHATAPTAAAASTPPTEAFEPLLQQALPNVKGKTFTSAIIDFPPGVRAAPHRHGQASSTPTSSKAPCAASSTTTP